MAATPLGQHIKALRQSAGLSISELGRRTDVSKSFLSRLELEPHDISVDTLIKIANVFGLGAGDLLVAAGYTTNAESTTSDIVTHKFILNVTTLSNIVKVDVDTL